MPNDFVLDSTFAKRSPALLDYIEKRTTTRKVCAPLSLAHPAAAVVDTTVRVLFSDAQRRYWGATKALRFTIAEGGANANAFACWTEPRCDWVILTSSLIDLLWTESAKLDRLAHLMQDQSVGPFPLGDALRDTPGTTTDGGSILRELLFASGIAFFIGHELGHLLDGHSSCYPENDSKAKVSDEAIDKDRLRQQALELRADRFGVEFAMRFAITILAKELRERDRSEAELAHLQAQVAYIATLGMSLALAKLRPVRVDLNQQRGVGHPPAAFRALWFSTEAINRMGEWFPLIDQARRQQIAKNALTEANAITVLPYDSRLDRFDGEVSKERLLRAINDTGIRKLIFDDTILPGYVEQLSALDAEFHPSLLRHQRK
jgi:hypothetical protein